ncbi:MAG: PEP-CTERM sorting domain-containing protein [Phycisphaerae bacterium]|nr:PEP-CTERM sorting domain-containing protein [Phycisphaerae bacterium]MDW8262340.1 PEP-CTERM sorting domain-containing protein [Phycisphaerales bacterium]
MRVSLFHKAAVVAAASLLASAGAAVASELLQNANLDRGYAQEIVPGFFLPKPDNWVNVGIRAITGPYEDEMSLEPWAGPAPTPVTTDGNGPFPNGVGAGLDGGVFFKPFTGNPANGPATGHLYQDVPGSAGLPYTLTGWAGAEANALMGGAEMAIEFRNSSNALISSSVLNLLPTLQTPNGQPFNYKFYTLTAVAPAGTSVVRARVSMIDGVPNPAGGGQAFVVDDFSLTIPEPSSLALMGLGGAVLLARRRVR